MLLQKGDGVLTPGGAIANLQGMLCARAHFFPEVQTAGNQGRQFVCFTSAHSHYTINRGANIMGIGLNQCRKVPVLATGKMDPDGWWNRCISMDWCCAFRPGTLMCSCW